jgi:MFS family permease
MGVDGGVVSDRGRLGADVTAVALGRRFHLLFGASAVSTLGDGIGLTALPLLAAHLSRDPLPVALVSSAAHLPWLVFGLIAGAIVDRRDRRRLMWSTDAVRAVLVIVLVVTVITGTITIWGLIVFAFLLGSAATIFDSAAQAMIPAVVPASDEALQRANSRLFGAQIVGDQLVGPSVGGFLYAAAAAVPFALDALSFAGSAALLAAIRGRFQPERTASQPRPSVWQDIRDGVRWLAHHRLLRTLALLVAAINIATMAGQAVLVLLATGPLHLSATGYGLLWSAGAIGGITASITATRIVGRIGVPTALCTVIILNAVGMLGVAVAPNAWCTGLAFAISSYAITTFNIAGVPIRQALVPDELRGRVISAYRMVSWGAIPIGGVLGGAISAWLGLRAPFIAGALILAGCAVVTRRAITTEAIASAKANLAPAVVTDNHSEQVT